MKIISNEEYDKLINDKTPTIEYYMNNPYQARKIEKLEDYNTELEIKIDKKDKEIERLKQGYCELKEKCNKGECDCTHEEYNNMCEENIKLDLEVERLNSILEEFEEELEREINIKEEDLKIEHNTYIDINSTLRKMLERFKELKGSDKE